MVMNLGFICFDLLLQVYQIIYLFTLSAQVLNFSTNLVYSLFYKIVSKLFFFYKFKRLFAQNFCRLLLQTLKNKKKTFLQPF